MLLQVVNTFVDVPIYSVLAIRLIDKSKVGLKLVWVP